MKLTTLILATLIYATASSQCLPDGITFTTQAQIDSFQTDYPGCTEIIGDVIIDGDDISSLIGLNVLSTINGNLIVGSWSSNVNPLLANLNGLDNLVVINEDLKILHCQSLTDLGGLESLSSIGNDLIIRSNFFLNEISSLSNITTIGNDIFIYNNISLDSLVGLDGITRINDITIDFNDAITDLDGLQNIDSIFGFFSLQSNDSLTSLQALSSLNYIMSLSISTNNNLVDLSGLEGLTKIDGYLSVKQNSGLLSLTGLENLDSITGFLIIRRNNELDDLSALLNITSIDGLINIRDNFVLTSLYGLDNIEYESISILNIINNPNLSTCEVQSVCDYLSSPNSTVEISSNASGCNSQDEVEYACETVSVNEVSISNQLSIYPNPFTTSTSFEYTLQQPSTVRILIFNHLGEQVAEIMQEQSSGKQQIIWNAEGESPGVYLYRMEAGGQVASGKMLLVK